MKINQANARFIITLILNLILDSFAAFEKQGIKLGKKYQIQINSICKEVSIPVNFKKSIIKASQISSNINKLLITDIQIPEQVLPRFYPENFNVTDYFKA